MNELKADWNQIRLGNCIGFGIHLEIGADKEYNIRPMYYVIVDPTKVKVDEAKQIVKMGRFDGVAVIGGRRYQ